MAVRRRRRCSALSVWRDLLEKTSRPRSGSPTRRRRCSRSRFGFVLLLLLHFSLVISRLADQNKVLAQKLGLLQQRVDELAAARRGRRAAEASPSRAHARRRLSGRRRRSVVVRHDTAADAAARRSRALAAAAGRRRRARRRRQRLARRHAGRAPRARPARVHRGRREPRLRRRLPRSARGDAAPLLLLPQPRRGARARAALDALRAAPPTRSRLGRVAGARDAAGRRRVNTAGDVVHWLGIGWAGRLRRAGRRAPAGAREVGVRLGRGAGGARARRGSDARRLRRRLLHVRRGPRPRRCGCGSRAGASASSRRRASTTTTSSSRATTSGSCSSATAGGRCSAPTRRALLVRRCCRRCSRSRSRCSRSRRAAAGCGAKLRAQAAMLRRAAADAARAARAVQATRRVGAGAVRRRTCTAAVDSPYLPLPRPLAWALGGRLAAWRGRCMR